MWYMYIFYSLILWSSFHILLTHSEQIFRVYFSFIIEKISKDIKNS